ncbi:MAG: hypothetical protein Q8L37_01430 [Candidatus Gottesmanbacteria bacterium]|nr:hypothetical protein [Candidatus Gottesmanbacteria bacterium]
MNPYLGLRNSPRLRLDVSFSAWIAIDCLIDTGFSGGLVLPESYKSQMKQEPIGYQEYELADGTIVLFTVYNVQVRYGKTIKRVSAFFTKSSEGLVGIEFLTGLKFVLDLRKISVVLE